MSDVPGAGQLMLASFPSSAEMVDVTEENDWYEKKAKEEETK
jgi:hypothetical protein